MPIKMIVTDLDRTLLRTDKTLSGYTADVLNRCRRSGIKVVFATARAIRITKRFCDKFDPNAIIADNGAIIYSNGAVIHKINIPADTVNSIIVKLKKCKKVTCMTVETGTSLLSNYTGAPWDSEWDAWNLIYTDFSQKISVPVTKFSVECRDIAWLNQLVGDYPELHSYSNSGEDWSQVMHRDATKWNGVSRLAGHFGIPLQEIVAFGDDYNDIGMLRECGVGVAVANALDEAKAAAGCVCNTNDNDGVAKWLEENVL